MILNYVDGHKYKPIVGPTSYLKVKKVHIKQKFSHHSVSIISLNLYVVTKVLE